MSPLVRKRPVEIHPENDQNPQRQLDALTSAGCTRIFVEKAFGAQCGRPKLRAALDYTRRLSENSGGEPAGAIFPQGTELLRAPLPRPAVVDVAVVKAGRQIPVEEKDCGAAIRGSAVRRGGGIEATASNRT
jgi:hypothetical protein